LVIDNNSSDNTDDVVGEMAIRGPLPLRRVVETTQGASHARNRGIEEARWDHLIYLDDDMIVDSGWLEGYVEAQEILKPHCVVGPVEPLYEGPVPPWITPQVLRSVNATYSCKGEQLALLPRERAHEIPGCNFGVLKTAAREAGGFDVNLGPSRGNNIRGEDFDFGVKLASLDKRTAYAPRCSIRHLVGRQKLSISGLRARYEGDGATSRAMMQLRGETPPLRRQTRLLLRMVRFSLRSVWHRLRNDKGGALEWELQARKIRGFLFKVPRDLVARTDRNSALAAHGDQPSKLFATAALPDECPRG
jgi:GT2 family glycosyltransferase